jgi:hypothetical protein
MGERHMITTTGGIEINRRPSDMATWEIVASYRHAWALATYSPHARLAQLLSDFLCEAGAELQRRGEWRPEALPPQSM